MRRYLLFVLAVGVLYGSGFLYQATGPVVYSLVSLFTLSLPLLLKIQFWKKIILLMPLIIAKVIGKYLLVVFGKSALARLMLRYGLLERRLNALLDSLNFSRLRLVAKWQDLSRAEQAWLILSFLPIAIGVAILTLFIKIIRLRLVRMAVENLLGRFLSRYADRIKK